MTEFSLGITIAAAIIGGNLIQPFIYKMQNKQEALDDLAQNRWNYVKHEHLNPLFNRLEALEKVVSPKQQASGNPLPPQEAPAP